MLVDGEPVSGSLFDFGLYMFHSARRALANGTGPYFYLPKLESHLEARLWNDVFLHAQDALGIPRGTIRATVLIETILAAFEMEEILYELREHSAGLNAGRWDYIFSVIKKFRHRDDFVLPDRAAVTMTVPFMRAYTELLVKTCHRRGAFAIGGMAAFIPSRRDPEVNEIALAKVREDKSREAGDGFDGTWVAHPDLVPTATEEFDRVLGERPNQLDRQRPEVSTTAAQLLSVPETPGEMTEAGVRQNVSVGIQYLAAWLTEHGAAAIYNLMEDVATAEISRSQLWQWVHHGRIERERVRGDRRRGGGLAARHAAPRRGAACLRAGRPRRRVRRVPDAARVPAARLAAKHRVPHPDVRLDVCADALGERHRDERAWNHVVAVLGEVRCPSTPPTRRPSRSPASTPGRPRRAPPRGVRAGGSRGRTEGRRHAASARTARAGSAGSAPSRSGGRARSAQGSRPQLRRAAFLR